MNYSELIQLAEGWSNLVSNRIVIWRLPYDYESWLFRIAPNQKDYRDLKELYIQFNARNAGNPVSARKELTELIQVYMKSGHEIFREFASLLEKYQDPIINSFIMVEKIGNGKIYDARLSNGSLNH